MKINSILNFIALITCLISTYRYLHIYQLKDYNNLRYLLYFKNKKCLIFILFILFLFLQYFFKNNILNYILYGILYILYINFTKNLIKSKKTPLKLTSKIKRLYFISFIILFLISFYESAFLYILFVSIFCPILSNFINLYDKIKNKHFLHSAKQKLERNKTKVIAITGSNGKTSVKNILYKILSTQYKTQCTPASYNTPLGISKFINNDLKYDCEFLILEFGARHKNDIKKLYKLFKADYGIVTTVSSQHLQTFKTKENVYIAKNELPACLENKLCIFNVDNLYVKRMYLNKHGEKLACSINEHCNIYAENIKITNYKTTFNLNINNNSYSIETILLGRHNVSNICLATALAFNLKITITNILNAIKNLKQVEHRLSLTKTHINILDDSYNCSPSSSDEALWVLKQFPNNKMVATPGIIEGGKHEYNINYKLGQNLNEIDYIVIIGEHNKKAILDGLKSQNHLDKNIFFAQSLEEAKHYFKFLHGNDTLLLLNDLPDDYT